MRTRAIVIAILAFEWYVAWHTFKSCMIRIPRTWRIILCGRHCFNKCNVVWGICIFYKYCLDKKGWFILMRIRECGMAHYIISRSEMCFEYEKEKSNEMNALLIATVSEWQWQWKSKKKEKRVDKRCRLQMDMIRVCIFCFSFFFLCVSCVMC